jgi:hypothetical protein
MGMHVESRHAKTNVWVLAVSSTTLLGMGLGGLLAILNAPPKLTLQRVPSQSVDVLHTLEVRLAVETPDRWAGKVQYRLAQGPEGAQVDPATGQFNWRPEASQGPGTQKVVVEAAAEGVCDQRSFSITVRKPNRPPVFENVQDQTITAGETLAVTVKAQDPDEPPQPVTYRLLGKIPRGATIDAQSGKLTWATARAKPGNIYTLEVRAQETGEGGLASSQSIRVHLEPAPEPKPADEVAPAAPLAEDMAESRPEPAVESPKPEPAVEEKASPTAEEIDPEDQKLLALYKDKKLTVPSEYPAIRKIFASRFQKQHAAEIQQAFGSAPEKTNAWLDEHVEIKEELYTAVNSKYDKVAQVLSLFLELKKQFPEKIVPYANLAIAIAVTWDDERGVYDYTGHQRRAKSDMPDKTLGAMENFQYMVGAEKIMQGRGQFLPWEFLVLLVDHRTPAAERQWAVSSYLPRRAMIGKCYSDVPYDHEMLETHSEKGALNGHSYTLANIRQYGGVCAMQADFASRVGKSLGVPAAYVSGASTYGELHAWVMWVEILGVNRGRINFSLQSAGRYRGDLYYVGNLEDPQTGQPMTDRQLELRLHTVGMNPQAKRQAELVMKCYPMLCEREKMDVNDRLVFLDKVIQLCPGNEDAWRAIAQMSREGMITAKYARTMMISLERLFVNFALFPDFTWTLFDDLVAFQTVPKQRNKLYERVVALYEQAGRPDLACEARLKFAEHLMGDKQYMPVLEGLAFTIRKFPAEGRYVPRLLDKLEEVAGKFDDGPKFVLQFYEQYLPMVPRKRGDRASPFCVQVLERALKRFQDAGQGQKAQAVQMELARLKEPR